ncbi:MAG: transglutaminase domain-containing protein [Lachnospiraceae bacterium]|nr:transglutaminase domain-containing protein [Lachnospiraceae bacterium]
MSKDSINKYTHIFFISIFLAFSAFALYLSFCDAYNYKGDTGKMFFSSLLFSFITCILWANHGVWYNIGKLAVNLVFVIVIIKNYQRIETECVILYQYIKKQSYLYKGLGEVAVNKLRTSVNLFDIRIYEKLVMILVVFLLITIMAIAVLKLKWYFLLMLPVVSIIGLEMFHGKAPSVPTSIFLITGMSGLLFSMKLEMHGGSRNFWQERYLPGQMPERYSLFMALIAICFIISLITGKATSQKIFTYSETMLKKQHKMETEIVSFAENLKKRVNNGADGYLNNNPPDHTGKSVMRIETSQKPVNNIYIKHFSSDVYQNGVWKPFNGIKPPVSESDINNEAVNSLKSFISLAKNNMSLLPVWSDDINIFNLDIIKDWKFTGEDTFIPYMYDTSQPPVYYNISDILIKSLMAMDSDKMRLYGIRNDNEEYDSFVYNNYFEVPYGLSRLKVFADEIVTFSDLWLACNAVKNAICKDTKYSQHLNALPAGEEYIEYFLFNQKRGYCEHYATAGTILLRMKGIPARYASGYLVRPSEFNLEYDKSGNEKYVAYVKDYNAHAWTEVYKSGFGWLPFDMTNTVTDNDYNSDADLYTDVNEVPQENPAQNTPSADTEPDEFLNEEDIGQEDFQENIDEETGAEEEINSIPEKEEKPQASEKIHFQFPKKLLIALLIVLTLSLPFLYIQAGFIKLNRKIHHAATSNQRVVMYFNLLNNYLGLCGFKGVSKLEDSAYYSKISLLAEGIASERAFNILQYAVFSNGNVNTDDEKTAMEFVQEISSRAYQRCGRLRRLIIYILTGRKKINIFTKVSN